ncbi:hypothetical protein E3E26_00840 [Thermococcus sp. LS1]|uniref:hypothetical protein n=1 Tax=Thermococcus sp. LS1 TaxID=1638259 RepID=UPI001439B989|nr:hypothetical protein [Thermococcus sp. LS1]NJD98353.1 hypothetical protein [Thermococcus sp. LS1]
MRRIVSIALVLLLLVPFVSAREVPYVYTPTVSETAFAVLALYKVGDYAHVLEGCEWLNQLKSPEDSWGWKYGEKPEAKYTALALMALIRGESIAEGRYGYTIDGAAYWLIYVQSPDGSFGDYIDTALSVLALNEYQKSRFGTLDVSEAISRGLGWLKANPPKNEEEAIFGYLALRDVESLKELSVDGEMLAYKYFALAYLGEKVETEGEFKTVLANALLLYATGNEAYRDALLSDQHFGFWGRLRYSPPELLEVSQVQGFDDLKPPACHYMRLVIPQEEWDRVVLAKYFLACGMEANLSGLDYDKLLPWMVAELARLKALMGQPYDSEVDYLLSHQQNGVWKEFYNTAYVVWVLRSLGVDFNYTESLNFLEESLTDSYPNYYYAYALIDFRLFDMDEAFNRTLSIIEAHQNPNGGWGYNYGAPSGLKSTATVLWALEETGIKDSETYAKGVQFLRESLYADIPDVDIAGDMVVLTNATFLLIQDGRYIGNSTGTANIAGLDGYVTIYPSMSPLTVQAFSVSGFRAGDPWRAAEEAYLYITAGVILLFLAGFVVWRHGKEKRLKPQKK